MFFFSPRILGEDEPILTSHIFSDRLVQPPTRGKNHQVVINGVVMLHILFAIFTPEIGENMIQVDDSYFFQMAW